MPAARAVRRRSVIFAGLGILLVVVVVITTRLVPGTSSGFSATLGDTSNTVGTAPNFSASGGVLPFDDSFAGSDSGWNDYGGSWSTSTTASGSVYTESAGGSNGNKAVTGQTSWTDYTVQGDVRINSGTQAGLLFRVTNPTVGADALNGYYLGIYTVAGGSTLTLGRENSGWTPLKSTSYAPVIGMWYHLTVQVVGCVITASVYQVAATNPPAPTAFTYTDAGCPASGAIGVRDYASTASFRNITATAGGTTSTADAPYYAPWAGGVTTGYTNYGGTWTVSSANETYSNTTGGQGEKSVGGTSTWDDYTLTGDVELNSAPTSATSAGFLVRVKSPATGVNSLTGYYAGISATSLVLTKFSGGTATVLDTDALPTTLGTATWYHLTVEAVGCKITATAQLKSGSALTISSATDTGCSTTGSIGLRTVGTKAAWRALAVTPR